MSDLLHRLRTLQSRDTDGGDGDGDDVDARGRGNGEYSAVQLSTDSHTDAPTVARCGFPVDDATYQ